MKPSERADVRVPEVYCVDCEELLGCYNPQFSSEPIMVCPDCAAKYVLVGDEPADAA